jgi:hypothetical protein
VLGLAYMPLNVVVMRAVDPTAVGPSLALVRLGMQIGGSVGSAMIITFINHAFDQQAVALQASVTFARSVIREFAEAHGAHAAMTLANLVSAQAATLAQADCARLLGVILLLAAPLPMLVRKHAAPARD